MRLNELFRCQKMLIARRSGGKDSLHGAEKKALLLGQLYVGPNSLCAPLVTVIVQFMYCLVLCCAVALLGFITNIDMLKSPLGVPKPNIV